jgi:hypothetical protein
MDFSSSRAANETFFDLIPHPNDILETAEATAEHTTEVVKAACNTIFDSAAAVNVELIAAGRSNVNATLEFAQMAIALRSPLELPAFMTRARAGSSNSGLSKHGRFRASPKELSTLWRATAQEKQSKRPLDRRCVVSKVTA